MSAILPTPVHGLDYPKIPSNKTENEPPIIAFSQAAQAALKNNSLESKDHDNFLSDRIERDVNTINSLEKNIRSSVKHETRNKILALLGVALAVACIGGAVFAGIMFMNPFSVPMMWLFVVLFAATLNIPTMAFALAGIKSAFFQSQSLETQLS